ncbi:hypothetical protein SmJEL517_g05891 [Synchytrium microbalum]|uniref:Periplasmic binding protein-like II n=1 Tax=Synchytrium microbalum TaxID=1806994 RepID=A0A507BZ23_9FUNG|nr:uncharacterized protein SmJEL517_g05891 [Synchytrium microbalum]TPX30595.1 hypothetical protein SmJEL517_g05891 [Synchytrium microbalum]
MLRYAAILVIVIGAFLVSMTMGATCPVTSYSASVDYFPSKYNITYASFSVGYQKSYVVLTDRLAANQYVLYLCNTPIPSSPAFQSNAVFVQIPVATVGVVDNGILAFLERLEENSSIAYIANPAYVTSPCLTASIQAGTIKQLTSSATPDVIFTSSTSSTTPITTSSPIIITSYMSETSPLARAEWIKFLSTFYYEDALGGSVFVNMANMYTCHQTNRQQQFAVGAAKLLWLRSDASGYTDPDFLYKQQLVNDAGASMLGLPTPSNSNSALVEAMTQAQVFIDDTGIPLTTEQQGDPSTYYMSNFYTSYGLVAGSATTAAYPFLQNKQVWRPDRVVSSDGEFDWPTAYAAYPEVAIEDLIHILATTYQPQFTSLWFRNLATDSGYQTITSSQCASGGRTLVSSCPVSPPVVQPYAGSSPSTSPTTGGSSTSSPSSSGPSSSAIGGAVAALLILALALGAGLYVWNKRQARIKANKNGGADIELEHNVGGATTTDTKGFLSALGASPDALVLRGSEVVGAVPIGTAGASGVGRTGPLDHGGFLSQK